MKRAIPLFHHSARPQHADVDVDALLAAINEISESEISRAGNDEDPLRVRVGGNSYHSLSELADAFELDIHDFSSLECNR